MRTDQRVAVILGAADGLTLAVSELIGLHAKHQGAIFASGLSAGLAELVGMTAALWLSSESRSNFLTALGCGIATLLACVLPCVPYAISRGTAALIPAAVAGRGALLRGLADPLSLAGSCAKAPDAPRGRHMGIRSRAHAPVRTRSCRPGPW